MLEVVWCEDDPQQRLQYEKIVKNYLLMKDVSINFRGTYSNPNELRSAIAGLKIKYPLFFLDIEYSGFEEDGLDLGQSLRKQFPFAEIVFVTTHNELLLATMERSVEPLGFVIKDDGLDVIQKKVGELLTRGYEKYTNVLESGDELFRYKRGNSNKVIPLSDVFYLETISGEHKNILYTKSGMTTFAESISQVEKDNPDLYRCSNSFLVNMKNAILIDTVLRLLKFENGESVNISVRNLKSARILFGETHKERTHE
ncbi:LytR/AlgR family response regulator transcription factor [Pediococcus claussenii]|uniref:Response regulator of the LytTR family n=1 Tax=Pediococcus claussenii (strain ATCC BAA-344 / DSM 14800 / JCM 18046 / KCTC 3811 / LMG 21948 / P06) TaxID=701521 RepID=G8PB39_PEDCP|nr:response regulator transcription factor [Pediococcus claussenii]AEV94668.1 Response regulator of the LytTR family [Pediococcus claussenii ATCC BAA-344]ANZ69865.1 hypothetical protein AYR57_05885 [Pediococcus claussenii]ANZ71682.1 hypothetical protein AYR58_05890 [Pediococcus claussenii]KRN20848.1 hypothetical protein IV79_GL000070 [Pediococcus claussenii]